MHRSTLWLIVVIFSLVLSVLTCGGGLLTLALFIISAGPLTPTETLPLAGVLALSLGLGVPLLLHGWAGWRGRPSRQFNPRRAWLLWLLLPLVIGLGALIGTRSWAPALLLPPIHVLAMTLPPLIMLWLVGWALRGTVGSWREVVASIAGASSLGFGASFIGEVLLVFALVVVVTVVAMLQPGGAEQVTALTENLQDLTGQQDITSLLKLLLSPVIVISALALFSIPVPLIEEAFKTLAVGVVARWVRPSPAQSFLWGVAGGVGFSLVENLLGGTLGGAEGWAAGAVSRFGATAMHCFTGGLVGWGWGQFWTARRPLRLLGCYAAAVTIHGLWNGIAVGAAFLSAGALVHGGESLRVGLASLGILALLGTLGLLTVVFVVALFIAGRRLASETSNASQDTAHI